MAHGLSALARFDPRKPLDDSQQGVVALLAAAVLLERRVERVHQRAAGEGDVLRERALEDETEVLLLEVDHEARPEVPGEHLRGVVLHRPRGSRAAGDDLPGALEIDALRLREHERLGDAEVVESHGDLVRELASLPRAVIADVDDGLAERLEERHRAPYVPVA